MHTITCFAAIRAAGAWAVAFLAWKGRGSAWTPSCAMLQSAPAGRGKVWVGALAVLSSMAWGIVVDTVACNAAMRAAEC